MNIFGIGGAELVVIVLIMLVVAGPQRMLRWAYILGKWAGRLRDMWKEAMSVIQKEIDEAGVDLKLPEEIPTRQNLVQWGQQAMKPYTDKMRQAEAELRGELADVEKDVKDLETDVKAVSYDVKRVNAALKAEQRPGKSSRSAGDGPESGDGSQSGDGPQSGDGSQSGGGPESGDGSQLGTWSAAGTDGDSSPAEPPASDPANGDAPTRFGTWSQG